MWGTAPQTSRVVRAPAPPQWAQRGAWQAGSGCPRPDPMRSSMTSPSSRRCWASQPRSTSEGKDVVSKGKVIGAIAAVLVIGGAAAVFAIGSTKATTVSVATVTREDLSVTIPASGKVEADSRVDLYPPTAGTLASIEVTEGQLVTAGQLIAAMDTAPIEAQVAQAQAAYRGALAQRDAATKALPGSSDKAAAQAAVDAAQAAYSAAQAAFDAAKAGIGAPSESDINTAKANVALAQSSVDVATAAYDSFYTNVYLPAAQPRDATLESTLAALTLARDQAVANLLDAQRALAALLAASNNTANVASAQIARDQAYAAYLGAVAQRDALTKASSVGSALESANAAVSAADAARKLANETLERARIVSPMDGVVLFNSAGASLLGAAGGSGGGGKPAVGSSVSPASAPFAVVSFETLAFTAQVDEADIVRVAPGMKTEITLDGLPTNPFDSQVQSIGKESVITPTGGTAFPVRLRFDSAGQRVLLGMNGSVQIAVETIPDTLTMPVEALLEEGNANYAYIVRNGRARRT